MLSGHVFDGLGGVEIKALRDQRFGSSSKLPLLSKERRATHISGGLRLGRRCPTTRKWTRGLVPQLFQLSVEEGGDPSFDGCRLFLPAFLSRWDEEH